MIFRQNKPLRSLGIYLLRDKTLILLKRTEELSFLFTREHWNWHGPVDFRVSHGRIYRRGQMTALSDADLIDTGETANQPTCSRLPGIKYH
jgi:hypothetical protein